MIYGDALEQEMQHLIMTKDHHHHQPIKIFGNLPFNIASQLLVHWMRYFHHYRVSFEVIITLQKEMAKRICSKEGTSERNRLSVLIQNYCETKILMNIPSSSFTPKPKVDASVLRLITRHQPIVSTVTFDQFTTFLQHLFTMKRKTIRQNLLHHISPPPAADDRFKIQLNELFENQTLNVLMSLRPQDLSLSQIGTLYRWCYPID